MSSYNNFIGFVPSTNDENVELLKASLQTILGITWGSTQEFLATNLYQVFQGFSELKMELENSVVDITRNYFDWFFLNKEKIGFSRSGTYEGIAQSFGKICGGMGFSTSANSSEQTEEFKVTENGVCLIALDYITDDTNHYVVDTAGGKTEPSLKDVRTVFLENFPLATKTYVGNTPPITDSTDPDYNPNTRSIEVEFSNGQKDTYYYTLCNVIPLGIQIKYRAFDDAIIPSGESDILKDVFITAFFKTQTISMDFEPTSFLSSQNVSWLAEVKVLYTTDITNEAPTYTEGRIEANFNDKFVLQQLQDQSYMISVSPMSKSES